MLEPDKLGGERRESKESKQEITHTQLRDSHVHLGQLMADGQQVGDVADADHREGGALVS